MFALLKRIDMNLRTALVALVHTWPGTFNSVPGCPAHAWLMAMASGLVITGHTSAIVVSLERSKPSISGEDTMHQAPKCVLVSAFASGP